MRCNLPHAVPGGGPDDAGDVPQLTPAVVRGAARNVRAVSLVVEILHIFCGCSEMEHLNLQVGIVHWGSFGLNFNKIL